MNNTFEDQLTASARRLREAQDAKLHVAALPDAKLHVAALPEITHSPTHLRSQYWGWITTPVAAAIGLLIGLFINHQSETKNDFIVPVVAVETTGNSILDDGADYSMFISM